MDPSTDYVFHGKTKTYQANTVKMNVKISDWPFQSIHNTLDVVIESDVNTGEGEEKCMRNESHGPSIAWTKLFLNGVYLYLILV